jgi:2-methylcitrate dehydratase PrpD
MLAGAASPAARTLYGCIFTNDGSAGSQIVGTGRASGPVLAAFANAFSGRVLDHDDVQTTETSTYGLLTHPTTPVLAAVLAAAQARNLSGEAMLGAYLAGVEVSVRLAEIIDPKLLFSGLSATATCGGIGALLAVAKLLGLRHKAIRSALAMWEATVACDGHATEVPLNAALRDAQSVRIAVEAVFLAEQGMNVDAGVSRNGSILEATSASPLAKRLGKPYSILEPGFAIRIYPSHPLGHPAIDLTLVLVNLHGMHANEIKRIEVDVTTVMGKVLSMTAPTSVAGLGRNLPFAIALAASKGTIVPQDFYRLPRQKVINELMARIECNIAPELDALGPERAQTIVRISLSGGRIIQMKADVAKGTPQKPLSEIELNHKFFQSALHSLDEQHAEQLLNQLWMLEEIPDVASLFKADASSSTHAEHSTGLIHGHLRENAPTHERSERRGAGCRR